MKTKLAFQKTQQERAEMARTLHKAKMARKKMERGTRPKV